MHLHKIYNPPVVRFVRNHKIESVFVGIEKRRISEIFYDTLKFKEIISWSLPKLSKAWSRDGSTG